MRLHCSDILWTIRLRGSWEAGMWLVLLLWWSICCQLPRRLYRKSWTFGLRSMRKERFRNMMGEFVPLISTPWCRQCHGVAVKIHADTLSFSTHPKPFQPLPPSPSKVLLTNPQQLPLPPMATKQHNLHGSQLSQPLFLNRHNLPPTPKTLPKHLRNSYNILQRHKPTISKPSSLRESSV